MKLEQAIFIPSCDKFSDLWPVFFSLFWKNWFDCPYNVYLGSNEKKYSGDRRVKNILIGKDIGWSGSLKRMLGKINERYLFVWPDDAPIISQVETSQFKKCFALMKKLQAKHIHFRCYPKPDKYIENNFLGEYAKGMPYKVNMAGFWDRFSLHELFIEEEEIGMFEIMGSYRASYSDGYFCLSKQLFSFIHLSDKGHWIKESIDYCRQHNIPIDLTARKLKSNSHFLYKLRDVYFNYLLMNTNWRTRVSIMNFFRKVLISY